MSPKAYRPDVDGLRCIAVLSVVIFHAFPGKLTGGFVGVDIFFVISGFLITGILLRDAIEGRFSILAFYNRRIRRIFPALLLILAACIGAGWLILMASEFAQLGKHVAGGAGFVSNFLFWKEINYFATWSATKPLLHLWSLGIEEQFYIVWPLLIYMLVRLKLSALLATGTITIVSFALCLYLTAQDPNAAFYSPLARCWQLSTGGFVAALALRGVAIPAKNAASLAGLICIAAAALLIDRLSVFPGWWAALPVLGSALIILAGPETWGNRLLSLKPAVWIGLISYPLYLWHWPLLSFALIANNFEVPPWSARLGLVLLAILLAWGTYRLVERPLKRVPPLKLFGAMAAMLLAGLAIYYSGGVPDRPVNRDARNQFLEHNKLLHGSLSAAYREECDFTTWDTQAEKSAIAPDCTRAGAKGNYFLWGDSHAQALSLGLRHAMPEGFKLAQVTTSGCRPGLNGESPARQELAGPGLRACLRSNRYALETIVRLKPKIVFLAQVKAHQDRDWNQLADVLIRFGAEKVVLVGPMPQWLPSLPRVVVKNHWPLRQTHVATGLDRSVFATDKILRDRYAFLQRLQYVSPVAELCRKTGCRAIIGKSLTVVDSGHLSPEASVFVGRQIMARAR